LGNKGVTSTTLIYSPQELHLPYNYTEQGGNKRYYVVIRNNTTCTVITEKGTVIKKNKQNNVLITQYICPDIKVSLRFNGIR